MTIDSKLDPGLRAVPVRRRGQRLETDLVVVEEPLEIRIDGTPLVVTMRTPGEPGRDEELAAGFLWAEGVIADPSQLVSLTPTSGDGTPDSQQIRTTTFSGDRIEVALTSASPATSPPAPREFRATAACGVCGKTEIGDLDRGLTEVASVDVAPELLETLPDRLRDVQDLFHLSGGIHAAGLFDLEGRLLCAREDIGRHNAVDKVIGHFVLQGTMPLDHHVLVVSGRAGFELVQKALKASLPAMVSVGAASSLAVSMATEAGMRLYSFAGPGRGNLHVGG